MSSVLDSAPRELAASKDGSVALPPEMLDELGWHEGDHLRVARRPNGEVVLTPDAGADQAPDLSPAERVERFRQSFAGVFEGVDPVAYQRALRDEWREPLARRERESADDA